MNPKSMEPYGLALLDFFNGDTSTKIEIRRDDGLIDNLSVGFFFREPHDFPPLERIALDLCRGYVLDVGAGAGCHSLALQNRSLAVCAIDISQESVEVMHKRGVMSARRINIFDFREGPFDTILILNHGIGLVENLPGLDSFLKYAHGLLNADGQILFDSLDVQCTNNPIHLKYQEANREAGRYFGEVRLQFKYKNQKGDPFRWLYIDPDKLADHASNAGWYCEIISHEKNGEYLAKLTPII